MGNYENDRAFEAVLQNTGNIDVFVDEFFSFLARRTDFFVVSPPEGGRVGFPPGIAAKLIISKYKKWEDQQTKQKSVPPPLRDNNVDDKDIGGHLEVGCNVELNTTSQEVQNQSSTNPKEPVKSSTSPRESNTTKANSSENKKETKKQQSKPKAVTLSDTYNGRKTDKYSWSQSIKELDVHIAVVKEIKTKKDVKVEIHMNRIRVATGTGTENEVVTDWHLPHPIVKDESYWSLHPGEAVFLCLQKVRELWWDHLFEGEEILDRTKIDAARPMEELADEEQAKIQELVWNQEQKLKGLPTSEESKMEDVMKKAWYAEGSPFKDEPFDMSRMQFVTSNTIPGQNPPPPS